MAIFGRKAPAIQIGDRFMKVGSHGANVYEVSRLWTATDGLPHAHLTNIAKHGETRIISVSALTDPQFFTPVPAAVAEA